MAKILAMAPNGKLVFEDPGDLMGADPSVNPCAPDPAIKLTVTWTDADLTKDLYGKTFTKGQSHFICPTYYGCDNVPGTGTPAADLYSENWYVGYPTSSATQRLQLNANNSVVLTTGGTQKKWRSHLSFVSVAQPSFYITAWKSYRTNYQFPPNVSSTFTSYSGLSTHTLSAAGFPLSPPIPDEFFRKVTTVDGVTIQWERAFPLSWNKCGL